MMRGMLKKVDKLFVSIVVLPTTLALLYFGLIASPIYVSESSFVVYSPNQQASGTELAGLLGTLGGSNSSSAAQIIQTYTTSWAALQALVKQHRLPEAYSNHKIDIFSRFGGVIYPFHDMVWLWWYYKQMVNDAMDSSTSISTLTVKAYTPQDAQAINAFLLARSQGIVNDLNANARANAIDYAQQDVQSATNMLQDVTQQLAQYRNGQRVFDPTAQSNLQLTMVGQLQAKLINENAQLYTLLAHTPDNPQVPLLRSAIKSLQDQIVNEQAQVTGSDLSLASKDPGYEHLQVQQQLAQSLLEAAVTSLEQANATAQKQELYLETISPPNLTDAPQEPKRLEDIMATLIVTLMLWGIARIVIGGVREHHGQ